MRNNGRRLLAALGSAAALAIAAQGALASSALQVNEGSGAEFTASGPLTFGAEGFGSTACGVTLNIELHQSIAKISRTLAGNINEARISACSSGEVTLLTREGAPWHIRYLSFRGTLPNIQAVRLEMNLEWLINIAAGLVRCLYRGILQGDLYPERRSITIDPTIEIEPARRLAGGLACPPGNVSGTLSISRSVNFGLI